MANALLGRGKELRYLRDCLPHLARPAERAVFVLGEAGIGKSALVAELTEHARGAGVAALQGRSTATTCSARCRPYAEVLSSLPRVAGTPQTPDLEPIRPVLRQLVPEWTVYTDQAAPHPPLVLAEAILRLLAAVGREGERGCLVVLEDLHHADDDTLTVTEYLVDNLRGLPVTLVATARPDAGPAVELARSAALRREAGTLHLDRIAPGDVEALAAQRLGARTVPRPALERLHADAGGNPFVVEETLASMVRAGLLVRRDGGWAVTAPPPRLVPPAVVASTELRVRDLPDRTRDALLAAALFGGDFRVDLLRAGLGNPADDPLGPAADRCLVAADEEVPGRYRFTHPLLAEALLAALTVGERRERARALADAVESGPAPDAWLPELARLRAAAGEPRAAARLHAAAGRAALASGAAGPAAEQFARAWELMPEDDPAERAELLDRLLVALTEAGEPARALAVRPEVESLTEAVPPDRAALLRAHVAAAAALAGRYGEGRAQVSAARSALGSAPAPALDIAEALLAPPDPALEDRLRAAAAPENPPEQVCAALEAQALAASRRDAGRTRTVLAALDRHARNHDLPGWRARSQARLAIEQAWRSGSPASLRAARAGAARLGHRGLLVELDTTAGLVAALRGEYARADELAERCRTRAERLGLAAAARYATLVTAVAAAHQGRASTPAPAPDADPGTVVAAGSGPPGVRPGLVDGVLALLGEDRAAAAAVLDSPSDTAYDFSLGLAVLLAALDGRAGPAEVAAADALPAAELRWNRQFLDAAGAVLHGRAGAAARAEEATARALAAAEPFPLARHLLLRLVAEAAFAGGWGRPAEWTKEAAEHFHRAGHAAVAAACRAMLRQAGVPVSQQRPGVERIPRRLRQAGVTAREFEVLVLLAGAGRLRNAEIAKRLFISARTVEKHVTSLLAKVGTASRRELAEFARSTLQPAAE